MFGKKKELEATIEELKAKLSEQEALNARLEQAIEEYFNSIGEEDENEEGESTAGLKAATAILP